MGLFKNRIKLKILFFFNVMLRASSHELGFQDLTYLPLNSMCLYDRRRWLGSRDVDFFNQDFGNRA